MKSLDFNSEVRTCGCFACRCSLAGVLVVPVRQRLPSCPSFACLPSFVCLPAIVCLRLRLRLGADRPHQIGRMQALWEIFLCSIATAIAPVWDCRQAGLVLACLRNFVRR